MLSSERVVVSELVISGVGSDTSAHSDGNVPISQLALESHGGVRGNHVIAVRVSAAKYVGRVSSVFTGGFSRDVIVTSNNVVVVVELVCSIAASKVSA